MLEKLNRQNYFKVMLAIALPISLTVLFQSSLGVIDQIMVGRLGEIAVSGVGLGGKIPTIFFFTSGAIVATSSILIAQFYGKLDRANISRAFALCFKWSLLLATVFFAISFFFAESILTIYTPDPAVREAGATYLRIVSIGFLPGIASGMIGTLFRSLGKVKLPTLASLFGVIGNTFMNYVLIFGKLGFPAMGVEGAAIATTITRFIELAILGGAFLWQQAKSPTPFDFRLSIDKPLRTTALKIMTPLFFSELLWSLGDNVYGIIYGHIGTAEMAAMVLIGPVIMLTIGFMAGFNQAGSVMVGNRLGAKEPDFALFLGKRVWLTGMFGSILFGLVVIAFAQIYPELYAVEPSTKATITTLLIVYAAVLWIKVSNMILGGVLKSGGITKYGFYMDLLGTWIIGVPLGLLAAFVFNWPIHLVYLTIAFEELVRLGIGIWLLQSKKWIKEIQA